MAISKRDLLAASASALATLATARMAAAGAETATPGPNNTDMGHDMSGMPASWHGSEKIAFLAYPQFTALDLVGPHYMLASLMGATTMIVAKTRDPVVSDQKLTFVPDTTFENCPADLDIICVPGGSLGTLAAMQDAETVAFLKDRGSRAKYVTSVCTGSLLLGMAGLLEGYKATSHWITRDVLKEFGAEPVDARVVVDRNRITGAGVTAGLDFGLSIVASLRDRRYAEGVQLLAEYAPDPPFQAGTPATATPENVQLMSGMFVDFLKNVRAVAKSR